MNVKLAVLADYATTTAEGKLVICGVFDTVFAPSAPVVHHSMYLALRVDSHPGEPAKHRLVIRLVDPDGNLVIPELDAKFDLGPAADRSQSGGLQLVLALPNVEFKTMGRHAVDILIDDRFEESVILNVERLPEPPTKPSGNEE